MRQIPAEVIFGPGAQLEHRPLPDYTDPSVVRALSARDGFIARNLGYALLWAGGVTGCLAVDQEKQAVIYGILSVVCGVAANLDMRLSEARVVTESSPLAETNYTKLFSGSIQDIIAKNSGTL